MKRTVSTISLIFITFSAALSQSSDIYEKYDIYRNPVRVAVNKFSITLNLGYGLTEYKHDLSGFYFYQDSLSQRIQSKGNELGTDFNGYTNWFNDPGIGDSIVLSTNNYPLDADSVGLSFHSISSSVPISLSVHYDAGKVRIGGGFTFEQQFIQPFKPTVNKDLIREFEPLRGTAGFTRLWGVIGYQFYDWWDYTFVGELRGGTINYGKSFNPASLNGGIYYNLGINIEKNLSEYFRIVIRPSYDVKQFSVSLPDGSAVRHTANALFVQFGVSINIPDTPRSPYQSDHIQLKHVITDNNGKLHEVRGQPMWKVQNPKVGQNHRRLWRYKLKNRRKIDPY